MGMKVWTQLDAVRQELQVHSLIKNTYCITLVEVIEDKTDEYDKIYAVLELAKYKETMIWCENSYKFKPNPILLDNGKRQFIIEKNIIKIIADLAHGLNYLHNEVGIIHRDLKP